MTKDVVEVPKDENGMADYTLGRTCTQRLRATAKGQYYFRTIKINGTKWQRVLSRANNSCS